MRNPKKLELVLNAYSRTACKDQPLYFLEVLIDKKSDLSFSDLKPYILHSDMRDWTFNAISNRLGNYGSSNQISKEKLIAILKPLIPVFEDLAEQEDQYKADAPKNYLLQLNKTNYKNISLLLTVTVRTLPTLFLFEPICSIFL